MPGVHTESEIVGLLQNFKGKGVGLKKLADMMLEVFVESDDKGGRYNLLNVPWKVLSDGYAWPSDVLVHKRFDAV